MIKKGRNTIILFLPYIKVYETPMYRLQYIG